MTDNEQIIATINERLNGQGEVIVEEAQHTGLELALACALVDQESDGRNIFGCDWGSRWTGVPPYCHDEVTEERVQRLLDNIAAGGGANGVGLTQLTYPPFVREAEELGGAHIPRNQCRVGFQLLQEYNRKYPYLEALGAYNAGEPNRWEGINNGYAAQLAEVHNKWKALVGTSVGVPPQEQTNFDKGIEYLLPAVGNTPYWYWPPTLDIVPSGVGVYATNETVPDINEVIKGGRLVVDSVDYGFQRGVFCMAVVNLIRRRNRKIVPTMGDDRYDGSTWAAQNFWAPFSKRFDRFAVYPRGTLIGRNFVWAGTPGASAVLDQGHVAVLMGEQNLAEQKDPMILQSHPAVGGLNYTRLGVSHNHWYYQYAVYPEDWINHDKNNF